MELLTQILMLLLIGSAVAVLIYLLVVLVRLKNLLENLNKTTVELNSRLPSILENIERASERLADVVSKAQLEFETIQNLSNTVQSYIQRIKGVFSSDSGSTFGDFPSGLTKILALIKAIRVVIAKLKI